MALVNNLNKDKVAMVWLSQQNLSNKEPYEAYELFVKAQKNIEEKYPKDKLDLEPKDLSIDKPSILDKNLFD